jgi:hypothetical protein
MWGWGVGGYSAHTALTIVNECVPAPRNSKTALAIAGGVLGLVVLAVLVFCLCTGHFDHHHHNATMVSPSPLTHNGPPLFCVHVFLHRDASSALSVRPFTNLPSPPHSPPSLHPLAPTPLLVFFCHKPLKPFASTHAHSNLTLTAGENGKDHGIAPCSPVHARFHARRPPVHSLAVGCRRLARPLLPPLCRARKTGRQGW